MADGLNDLLDDLETGGGSFTREQRAEIKRAVDRFAKRQKKETKNALGNTPKTPTALEQEEAQLEKGKEKFLPKKRWPMKPAALDTTFADQYSEAYKTIREAGSKPAEFITSFTGLLQLEGQLANFLSAIAEGTFANEDIRKMVANGLKSYITAYIGKTIVNKEGEMLKEVAKNDMPGYATAILQKVADQIAVPRIPPNVKKPDAPGAPKVPGAPKDANAKPSRLGSMMNSARSMVQKGVERVRGKSPDGKTADGKTPATTPKTPEIKQKSEEGKTRMNAATKLQSAFRGIKGRITGEKKKEEKAKKENAKKEEEKKSPQGPDNIHPPGGPNAANGPAKNTVVAASAPPSEHVNTTPGAPTPSAPPATTVVAASAPPTEQHNAAPVTTPGAPAPGAQVQNGQLAQDHNAKIAADVQAHIQQSELKGKTGLVETQQKLEHNVKNIADSKAKGEELKAKDAQLKEELKALQANPNVTVAQLEQHQQKIEQHQTALAKNEKDTSKLEKRQEMLGKRAATETKLLDKTGFNKASTSEKGAYYAKRSLRSANKTMKSAASSLSKLGSKLKKSFTRKAPLDPAAKAAADAAAKDAYVQKQNRANELKGKTGQALEEAKLRHAQEDRAAVAAKRDQLRLDLAALQTKAKEKDSIISISELKEKERALANADQQMQKAETRVDAKRANVSEMKNPGLYSKLKAAKRSAKQSLLSASEKTGDAATRLGKAFTPAAPLTAEQKQAAEKAKMEAFKTKQNREIDLLGKTGSALEAAKLAHAQEDKAAAMAKKDALKKEYNAMKNDATVTVAQLKEKENEIQQHAEVVRAADQRVADKERNKGEMITVENFKKEGLVSDRSLGYELAAAKRSAKQSLLKTADRTGRALAKTGKAIKAAVSGSEAQTARDANLALADAAAQGAVQSAASATGTAAASSYESAKGAVQSAAERAKGAVQSAAPGLQRAASFGKEVAKTTGKVALGVGAAAALGAAVGTAHAAEPLLAIAQYARDSAASRSAASRAAKGLPPRNPNVVDPTSLTAAVGHARRLTKLVLADALQKYAYLESEDEKTKAKALKEVRRKAAEKQAEYEEKKARVNRSFQSVALLKKKRANLQKQLDALHSAEDPDQSEIDDVQHAFEMADHEIQRQEVEMQDFKNDLLVEQSEVDQTRAEVQIVEQKLHPETVVGEEISDGPPLAEAYVVETPNADRSHLQETIKNGKKGYDIGGKRTRRRRRKARASKAKARPRRAQTKQRPCGTKKGRTRFISEDCFL